MWFCSPRGFRLQMPVLQILCKNVHLKWRKTLSFSVFPCHITSRGFQKPISKVFNNFFLAIFLRKKTSWNYIFEDFGEVWTRLYITLTLSTHSFALRKYWLILMAWFRLWPFPWSGDFAMLIQAKCIVQCRDHNVNSYSLNRVLTIANIGVLYAYSSVY